MALDFRMWLISLCTIALASLSGGCLNRDEPYYGMIGYDSHIILSYDKTTHPINESVYSTLIYEINATGIQARAVADCKIATICYDDLTEKSNHLGGGIELNFTKWVEYQNSYRHRINASDFPYVNDTHSAVVIDNCYLTDKRYSASSNLTNITEPFRLRLKHYNDMLSEILPRVLDARIESEQYTPRGKIVQPVY